MNKRKKVVRRRFYLLIGALLWVVVMVLVGMSGEDNKPLNNDDEVPTVPPITVPPITVPSESSEAMGESKDTSKVQEFNGDPNNSVYPFNTMSADWGAELYESGFNYYSIPEEYEKHGGCFPEVVQAYLWYLCEDRNIDYYIVVALIERESNYKYNASGDNGNSVGYMQIYEKWHKERMEAEGVTDLYNPYENIRVGLNFLEELFLKYEDPAKVLMAYNMGESGAKKLWDKGVFETDYSNRILTRSQEIKQDIQDQ
jgi:hypothetical protein